MRAGIAQLMPRVAQRHGVRGGDRPTFHGRDVFGYTGALLAAGVISFEQVGPMLPPAALVYINSLMDVAIALNLGNYAAADKVGSGVDWLVEISRP